MKNGNLIIFLLLLTFLFSCTDSFIDEIKKKVEDEKAPTYRVIYNGNGEDAGEVPVDPNEYKEGDTVTVLGNPGNLIKLKYLYAGWNTKPDRSGDEYVEGDTFEMGSENVTLYAHWKYDLSGITNRDMAEVKGGTFLQQNIVSEEFTHTVSSFSMGKYEVTYDLWYEVYNWAVEHGYNIANPGREGSEGTDGAKPSGITLKPVANITWRDAIVWCNAYSEISELTPVYYTDPLFTTPLRSSTTNSDIDTTPGSEDNPYVNWNADGYRLPTEGEWMYAASYIDGSSWLPMDHVSGDTTGPCYLEDGGQLSTVFGDYVWYQGNSGGKSQDVGAKKPNFLDIYDMSGNLQEWCWDWYAPWPTSPRTDYRGPNSGIYRKVHRGTWKEPSDACRVGCYANMYPYTLNYATGFRVVRSR